MLGIAMLCVMDGLIKSLSERLPLPQIVFLRYGIGLFVVGALLLAIRPPRPSLASVRANLVRSLVVVGTATTFFYALAVLPLAEAVALSFCSPIFTALLGALLLGEPVSGRVAGAIGLGFGGMLVMTFAGGGGGDGGAAARPLLGVLAALGSAVFYALSTVLLRARAKADSVPVIVAFQHLAPTVIFALPAWLAWRAIAPGDMLLVLSLGMLGSLGHFVLAGAYAKAPAAKLSVLEYTALIWAAGIGYVVFAETPTAATLLGAALIAAGAAVTSTKGGAPPSAPSTPETGGQGEGRAA